MAATASATALASDIAFVTSIASFIDTIIANAMVVDTVVDASVAEIDVIAAACTVSDVLFACIRFQGRASELGLTRGFWLTMAALYVEAAKPKILSELPSHKWLVHCFSI